MNKLTSSKDLEKLSAFLDGQLKPSEGEKLRIRLSQDANLREEFNRLRYTRAVIKALPWRNVPRNFTLSPGMVQVARPRPVRPVFGIMSAVAVLLLLFILVGDFLVIPEYVGMFQIGRQPAANNELASAKKVMESEPLIFPTEAPSPPAQAALEAPAEEPMGGGVEPTLEVALNPDEDLGAPMAEIAPSAADEMPATGEVEMFSMEPTSTPEVIESVTPEVMDVATETALRVGDEGSNLSTPEPAQEPAQDVDTNFVESGLWLQLLFWMTELFLIIIAIGSLLVTVFLRLRRS